MIIGMPILFEYDSIEENIRLARQLKLDFIELNLNFEYCRKDMETKNIDKLLIENSLLSTLHFYDEADFASYDEVVDAYLRLLEKYCSIGSKYIKKVNIHLNEGPLVTISGVKNYIYEKEYDQYIKRLVINLNKAKNICEKNNIELVLENTKVPTFLTKTFLDLAKEGFCFNYDVGHDDNDNYHLKSICEKLTIKEMHIHDGNQKKCHLAIGEGNIDIPYFKKIAIKNNAYVVLEVKSSDDLIISVPRFKNK